MFFRPGRNSSKETHDKGVACKNWLSILYCKAYIKQNKIWEIILSLLIGYLVWHNYVVLACFRQFIFQPPHSPKQDGNKFSWSFYSVLIKHIIYFQNREQLYIYPVDKDIQLSYIRIIIF